MIEVKKIKKGKVNKMNFKKIIITSLTLIFISTISFAEEKLDCSTIKKNTGAGWLKSVLCKKGSNKLDSDGNFKKGTFNIIKKLKKN